MISAACIILQAHHRLPEAEDVGDLATPEGMQRLMVLADGEGKTLNHPHAHLQSVDKPFGRDALGVFDLPRAMAKRNLPGAPGTKQVAKQLGRWSCRREPIDE